MIAGNDPEFTILRDPNHEESDPLAFRVAAVTLLFQALHSDSQLRVTPLYDQILRLLEFINADASTQTNSEAEQALMDLEWFASIGKALAYIGLSTSPQFRRELSRFAAEPDGAGNQFLFYIAGTLSSKGYDVTFVPERSAAGEKTPDLMAARGGKTVWIEANAKQPTREIDTTERIWQLIRDIIAEKKLKFTDQKYSPGMIVADISPAMHLVNDTGLPPKLKLRPDLCRPHPTFADGFIYRLYEDSDWHQQPENQGNVFSFAVEEFSAIDRSRYHVFQCLLTLTRHIWRDERAVVFPKAHQLLVHRSAEPDGLVELSKHVYVVA
jgi:hypothetical protein